MAERSFLDLGDYDYESHSKGDNGKGETERSFLDLGDYDVCHFVNVHFSTPCDRKVVPRLRGLRREQFNAEKNTGL